MGNTMTTELNEALHSFVSAEEESERTALDALLKCNESMNYPVPEGVLVSFYEHDAFYWANEEADIVIRTCEDAYQGAYSTGEEYAEEYFEASFDIPDDVLYYIDHAAVWRDLERDGYYITDGFVFSA